MVTVLAPSPDSTWVFFPSYPLYSTPCVYRRSDYGLFTGPGRALQDWHLLILTLYLMEVMSPLVLLTWITRFAPESMVQ